tara:strand:+ start:71 stop:676 length:606 start_codon:yes stop_codon:yes gene_type:complete
MVAQFDPNQIGNFKSKFDGGTRPNRFVISGSTPSGKVDSLMIKAGSMPAQSVGIMQMPFRGRVAKLPGDRVYADWTFTIVDTITNTGPEAAGDSHRKMFRDWQSLFNAHKENVMNKKVLEQMKLPAADGGVFQEWTVTQLDMMGKEIPDRTIALVNCWPIQVGEIALSYDTADQFTEYNVTLAYDYIKLKANSNNTGRGKP